MLLVLSRLDYGGATFACLSARLLERLQPVLNAAAWPVLGSRKYDHATTLLHDLQWLHVLECIRLWNAVLVYHCQHRLVPPYFADEFQHVAEVESRQRLRFAWTMAMVVPSTMHSTIGDLAFPIVAARVWSKPSTASDVIDYSASLKNCSEAFENRKQNCSLGHTA